MKKVLSVAVIGLLLALALRWRAAGAGPGAASTEAGTGARRTPELLSTDPPVIRTSAGQTLRLAGSPRRILPANAGVVDALALLIGPERVVALPAVARDYSRFDQGAAPASAWERLPTFVDYRAEVVLELDPDLVLVSPWQSPQATELLGAQGLPVLVLPVPHTWEEALDTLTFLGELLGAPERAASVRASLERRAAQLAAGPLAAAHLRALSYTNFGSGGTTAGAGTTIDVLLRLAGLVNAAAEAGIEGYGSLPDERLLALDPDVLLVSAGEGRDDSASLQFLRASRVLTDLPALRDDHIVTLPSALASTTSVRLLDAAEEVARILEPRLPLR